MMDELTEVTPPDSVVPVFLDEAHIEPGESVFIPSPGTSELRQRAYELEADPLFFKYHRGEATQQEWLDKIEEIRARYPYPEEVENGTELPE